ncbi:MAG: hypothetical protein HZB53_06330 [Chloroflexi bacterium]|nr:hypothetical protein [Chloroflexota bacterium]
MPKNPLAEVFGFPVGNMSADAQRSRQSRFCPFNNSSGIQCTKSSATDPLGVCTIFDNDDLVVTCPVRFRDNNIIVSDAASFFFPGSGFVVLTEVRLRDKHGKPAGDIDMVLAKVDDAGQVLDFGAIEVQAVYISGNVRNAFKKYMEDPAVNHDMEWRGKNYPNPDYLSSSRKRLAPQLIFKGGILHAWQKKMAVVVDEAFFNRLPKIRRVNKSEADIAWMVYGLRYDHSSKRYILERRKTLYTLFESALETITKPSIGDVDEFVRHLQQQIKKRRTKGMPAGTLIAPDVEPAADLFDNE